METRYNPIEIEEKIYKYWENKGFFYADVNSSKKKYVIVIPPPNITGFLHMGHALNNTIQDILIRWKRMSGFNTLWVPGTDHAGIATQNVVERELLKKGITRKQIGREKFLEEVWKWKEKYGSRIIYQLKKLGASCDWTRIRFTMDEMLSNAVKECFVRLYKKGLIYKGKKIINWCPRCETALADEEVEYREEEGFLYYLKYPIWNEKSYIEVATTRPETMLGDTAVAVHPSDKRYINFIGKKVKLPFVKRLIPIISEEKVEIGFGTGAVKVTPAHDPLDFEIAQKHGLPFIIIMNESGIMNENAGEFKGYDRFKCREEIIKKLTEMGLLSKIENYTTRIGHCYRCDTIIEPYLSTQWFVKMKPLAEPAIKVAEENKLKFYPERWKKIYLQWLYNVKDWCISRQIWWGHRIPIWYCSNNCPPIVEKEAIRNCPYCGNEKVFQDENVLDTWFSSWLWPFSVFGWPEKTKELEIFYPTDTLVTAQEILFFWVARMVMAGLEFMGEIPFENVYIHGTVRDKSGKKMSKSLGNAIDPVEIIEKYGADSLRFSLISQTAFGQDVFLAPDFHIKGRNFTNKIWNAARYILKRCEELNVYSIESLKDKENIFFPEKWILTKQNQIIEKTEISLNKFHFNEALNNLYDFFWHDFCDWYIEISKVYEDEKYVKNVVLPVLFEVMINSLKLLHPFIPFITEELWQNFKNYITLETESITISHWPFSTSFRDLEAIKKIENLKEIIITIRNIKARFKIKPEMQPEIYYEKNLTNLEAKIIEKLSGIKKINNFWPEDQKNIYIKHLSLGRLGISFYGIINISEEKERRLKEIEKLRKILSEIEGRLSDSKFLQKAGMEIIEKEKNKKTEIEEKIKILEEDIKFLQERSE